MIEPLIPGSKRLGRKIDYARREILNAIFYLNRNGCAWRDLPGDLPPYGIVSHYYHAWRRNGLWQSINEAFRMLLRVAEGRDAQPSAASNDLLDGLIAIVALPKTMNGCLIVAKQWSILR